jgi:hypothetical protein
MQKMTAIPLKRYHMMLRQLSWHKPKQQGCSNPLSTKMYVSGAQGRVGHSVSTSYEPTQTSHGSVVVWASHAEGEV